MDTFTVQTRRRKEAHKTTHKHSTYTHTRTHTDTNAHVHTHTRTLKVEELGAEAQQKVSIHGLGLKRVSNA